MDKEERESKIIELQNQIVIYENEVLAKRGEITELYSKMFQLRCEHFKVKYDIEIGSELFYQGEPCVLSSFEHDRYGSFYPLIKKYNKNGKLLNRETRLWSFDFRSLTWSFDFRSLTKTKEEYKPFVL